MGDNSLPITIGIFVCALLLISIWRRLDHVLRTLHWGIFCALVGFVIYGLAMGTNDPEVQSAAVAIGFMSGAVVFVTRRPKPSQRRRSIRAVDRRNVISKWQIQSGQKFNSRFHEIDHVVPFSQGGNETEDNLRVMERKRNRSKGAKAPWWDLLDRR